MAKRPRAVQTPREATVTVRENRTKRQRRSNPQELGDWKAADYNAFDLRFRHDFASDSLIVVPDGLSLENEATLFLHLFEMILRDHGFSFIKSDFQKTACSAT